MEEKENKNIQSYTQKSSSLKVGLEGFFFGFVIIVILFFVLNYFNIVSLSKVYPKIFGLLPHRPFEIKTLSPNQNLSPKKEAPNPFKEPVKIEGTDIVFSVKTGIVHKIDTIDEKDGIFISLQTLEGDVIPGLLFAPGDLKAELVKNNNGIATSRNVNLKELRKGDFVIISYNEDAKTKEGKVTAIRINRQGK